MSHEVQSPYERGFYFCNASCTCRSCLYIDGRRAYFPNLHMPLFKGAVDTSEIPAPRDFPSRSDKDV